jgi:hypothetical protein
VAFSLGKTLIGFEAPEDIHRRNALGVHVEDGHHALVFVEDDVAVEATFGFCGVFVAAWPYKINSLTIESLMY